MVDSKPKKPSKKSIKALPETLAKHEEGNATKKTVKKRSNKSDLSVSLFAQEMQQARELENDKNWVAAESQYKAILEIDSNYAPAWHSLGLLAFNLNKLDLAAQYIARSVQCEPTSLIYQRNFGEISRRSGRIDHAIAAGIAATKISPKDLDSHYNLGLAYTDAKDFRKAITSYRRALKINPLHGLSWNNLGSALEAMGDKPAALSAYQKAVEINPKHAEAQNNQGAIYSEQGKLDLARSAFENAIAASPYFIEAHYNVSSLKSYTLEDPHLSRLEDLNNKVEGLSNAAKIRYHFALGKALEDTAQYDRAFSSYEVGNILQHALLPIDEKQADYLVGQIKEIFSKEFFSQRRDWVGREETPIFIVGMPRSGTTLLEQILSTHPSVYGAGELMDLNEVITKLSQSYSEKLFVDAASKFSEKDIQNLGVEYVSRVWGISPQSEWITDKMPANFFYIGLIHLAFPNAKIIHAMRDPMDSCFSCYSRLFNETMEFAYDLKLLGRYYNRYIALMNHWHSVLPKNAILDLRYEDLVEDLEGQARRVLEYVGIPWDPKCLDFYQNPRLVKTASVAQVRRPIYKTSVERWRHFARHLKPLMEIVAPHRLSELQESTNLSEVDGKQTISETQILIDQVLSLQSQNKHDEVIKILHPDASFGKLLAHAYHLLGISYYRLNRFLESKDAYENALKIQPEFPILLNSYGFLLQDLGLLNEAHDAFNRAVNLAPEFAMARLNLGMVQLKLGDWKNGWDNYESRWTGSAESANPQFKKPQCPIPQWDGHADTSEKSLLIITEQGFGDTFQFARYLKLAAKKFSKVGFVSSIPTLRLLEWGFGDQITLLSQMPTDYSAWDLYCPLLSLPRAFNTTIETIPKEIPYFNTLEPAKNYWKSRLERASSGRFYVGIAWAGRNTHQYDARRSLSLEKLMPILGHPNITWVSLQKWNPQEAKPELPAGIDWIDWTDDFTDFADTASLISNLDLVISVDSSMVHLAGALGKSVWMMNRFDSEWRWLNRRSDSPWYPSLRIFNQDSFGDWNSVISNIKSSLDALNIPDVPRLLKQPIIHAGVQHSFSEENNEPPQILNIEQSIQIASQMQGAGRLPEAESLLMQVLQIKPRHPNALHLLGLIAYQKGDFLKSVQLIKSAISEKPDVALFRCNLIEIYRQAGEVNLAIECGREAIAVDPTMASSFSNLGVALFDAGLLDESAEIHHRALLLEPKLLQSLNNLGSIARAKKNQVEAIDWYRKAISVDPEFLESLSNLGAVLVEADRAIEAQSILEKALKLSPNSPEALCNLGLAYLQLDLPNIAKGLFDRCLQLRPHYSEALSGLARLYQDIGLLKEAERLLKMAQVHGKGRADVCSQLGAIYMEQGLTQMAEEAFNSSLILDPDSTDAMNGMANLKIESGDVAGAAQIFNEVIAKHPDNMDARYHLLQIDKVRPGDANMAAIEAMYTRFDSFGIEKQISLNYALGKGYEDLGQYDRAFEHFTKGAALKRSKVTYSPIAEQAYIQKIIDTFTPQLINRLSSTQAREGSDLPIFILGMPRSGTTLTEQIISSHPKVHGAGELFDLFEISQSPIPDFPHLSFPDNLEKIDEKELLERGHEYVKRLKLHDPTALRITDKMPSNYLLVGLIHVMLPNAKIIHVKRNPIDTCLSCYTRLFNRNQEATYDLVELGQHYMNYHGLMEHWKRVLPKESFIEVQYEDLVRDVEGQAKRLIEKCDLAWDPVCLSFYENTRSVRTASVTQVRKPIYANSIEKWRLYEKQLAPLLTTLSSIL